MATVGVKELKDHLSEYLRRARNGERIVVTERGKAVVELQAVGTTAEEDRLWEMVRKGRLSWEGGKPRGLKKPPKVKGCTVADAVIEDRR